MVLPGYPVEAVMNDITLLEVNFYVSLPDDASKAPLRDTNYVIPRSTLNEIVQLDSGIIEAVVRDSVSASFTQGNSGSSVQSSERRWREATIAISVIAAVILSVIVMVMIVIAVYKSKRRSVGISHSFICTVVGLGDYVPKIRLLCRAPMLCWHNSPRPFCY